MMYWCVQEDYGRTEEQDPYADPQQLHDSATTQQEELQHLAEGECYWVMGGQALQSEGGGGVGGNM